MVVENEEVWVVDKIISHCTVGRGKNARKQYQLRWKGYEPEHDQWVNKIEVDELEALDNYEIAVKEMDKAVQQRHQKN